MTRIAICVPGHTWHGAMGLSLARLKKPPGCSVEVFGVSGSILPIVRTMLVEDALSWGADYVLFVDSDMLFPDNALLDLMAHDTDFVAAGYPKRVAPYVCTAEGANGPLVIQKAEGVTEAHHVGLGLALVKANALKSLAKPYFKYEYSAFGDLEQGEDAYFCCKLRAAGFQIKVDNALTQRVRHIADLYLSNAHTLRYAL